MNPRFPHVIPLPPIVISSEREKSFSFAVKQTWEDSGKRETQCSLRLAITVFPAN